MSDEKELEQQGEIAADFIEEFLDVADLDGDLEIEFKKERVYISVQSDAKSNLGKISDPDTVEAVQELARLAVQAKTGEDEQIDPRYWWVASGKDRQAQAACGANH